MSNGQVPASGDWYGIVSKGSTGKVLVDYASINHYTNGVRINSGSYTNTYNNSDTVSVTRTKFYAGGSGIYSDYASSYRPIVFTDNTPTVAYMIIPTPLIRSIVISRSRALLALTGYVRDGSNTKGELYINNNTFDRGRIYVYYARSTYSTGLGTDVEVNNNTLSRGSEGIEFNYLYNNKSNDALKVDVSNNVITGNSSQLSSGTRLNRTVIMASNQR